MIIYIVENYDTDKCEAFETLEQAATYVRKYYKDHMVDWFNDGNKSVEEILRIVKSDLENLECNYPFIEDTMYIRTATLHS